MADLNHLDFDAPIDLDQFKEAITAERGIEVIAGGKTFRILPPELLSDTDFKTMQTVDDGDVIGQARLMVDDYDGFVAAGGSAMIVTELVRRADEANRAKQGADSGESGAS